MAARPRSDQDGQRRAGDTSDPAGVRRPDPVLLRRGNLVVTRDRLLQVGGLVVLLLLGAVLPYLALTYVNNTSVTVTAHPRVFSAASLLGGIDPTYLPGYAQQLRSDYDLALNFAAAGPGLQQVGTVVAILTGWGLLTEEINKFVWWPLHLSAYLLLLSPVALLVGTHQLSNLAVPLSVGPGWLFAFAAGVLVLVTTLRARGRIDTYASF